MLFFKNGAHVKILKNMYIHITESLCFTAEINNSVNHQYFKKKNKIIKE